MMQLYVKTGCPYCAKVLKVLNAYQVPFEEKNVSNIEHEKELLRIGGKRQMPFMVDGEVSMYESDDIIKYIEDTYRGEGANKKPRVHFGNGTEVCPS